MLSIEQIRRDPEFVRQALATRGEEGPLDELLTLDSQRRQAISRGDELRARRNQASRAIGQLRAQGQEAPEDVVREMREVGREIDALEQETKLWMNASTQFCWNCPTCPGRTCPGGSVKRKT